MQEFKEKIDSDFRKWGHTLNVGEFSEKIKNSLNPEGFKAENSRLIFSVCSDDYNRLEERENIEKAITNLYGREFHLGGLAGYPISGISGIIEACHHAPNNKNADSQLVRNGNLIFFVSPHVGLIKMEDFYYGRIIRPYQQSPSACCDAIMRFLTELKQAEEIDNLKMTLYPDNLDPSISILQNELLDGYKDKLLNLLKLDDVNSQVIQLIILNCDLILDKIKFDENLVKWSFLEKGKKRLFKVRLP